LLKYKYIALNYWSVGFNNSTRDPVKSQMLMGSAGSSTTESPVGLCALSPDCVFLAHAMYLPQATFFYAFATLTRAMVALKSVTARWRAKRLQWEAAVAHHMNALKRRAVHAWKAAASRGRLKREQVKVADAWFR
jgi:carbon starvation protein CstA